MRIVLFAAMLVLSTAVVVPVASALPPACVRTDATCGPAGNAWVALYAEAGDNIEVCVTSNTGNVLC